MKSLQEPNVLSRLILALAFNNIVTFFFYIFMMQFFHPNVAYFVTWLLGMSIVFILYPVIIFQRHLFDIGAINFIIFGTYFLSFTFTMMYVYLVSKAPSLFISCSSIIINASLNFSFLWLFGQTNQSPLILCKIFDKRKE